LIANLGKTQEDCVSSPRRLPEKKNEKFLSFLLNHEEGGGHLHYATKGWGKRHDVVGGYLSLKARKEGSGRTTMRDRRKGENTKRARRGGEGIIAESSRLLIEKRENILDQGKKSGVTSWPLAKWKGLQGGGGKGKNRYRGEKQIGIVFRGLRAPQPLQPGAFRSNDKEPGKKQRLDEDRGNQERRYSYTITQRGETLPKVNRTKEKRKFRPVAKRGPGGSHVKIRWASVLDEEKTSQKERKGGSRKKLVKRNHYTEKKNAVVRGLSESDSGTNSTTEKNGVTLESVKRNREKGESDRKKNGGYHGKMAATGSKLEIFTERRTKKPKESSTSICGGKPFHGKGQGPC